MTDSGMDGMSMEALIELQGHLDQLEKDDNDVSEARARLDAAIDELGRKQRERKEAEDAAREEANRKCDGCGAAKFTPHHETCYRYGNGEPVREAGGYQYYNEDMKLLHTTSVPKTDKEALAYFHDINRFFATSRVKYIWRRAMWQGDYLMMPYEFNRETEEVEIIGGTPISEEVDGD